MSGVTLFERLALAQISGNLRPGNETQQRPIDRVCALGFAPRLGSLLIRLKGSNDAPSYLQAKEMIAGRLYTVGGRKNWGHYKRMVRVSEASLSYYLFDMCGNCDGRGKLAHSYNGMQEEDAGQACGDCGGTGKAPRNVPGRARAILVAGELPRLIETILDAADGIVERSARIATGISRWKLYGTE